MREAPQRCSWGSCHPGCRTTCFAARQRVLVVDDDPETRKRVGEALERAGFVPGLAATGEQGLLLLRHWPRRIGWLYTKPELPGLVDGGILADEFHQAHPSRLVLYGCPHTRKYNLTGGIALTTPVSPRRVGDVLLEGEPQQRRACLRGDALGSLRRKGCGLKIMAARTAATVIACPVPAHRLGHPPVKDRARQVQGRPAWFAPSQA